MLHHEQATFANKISRHAYLNISKNLRNALEHNEFEIYFQPKISLSSGAIDGAEALLRWNSKELGFIPPSEFIPIAETSGLIVPLGEWVLWKVCSQSNAWKEKGYTLSNIAINFSALQFKSYDIIQKIYNILYSSMFDPQCLEVEITESVIVQDFEKTNKILSQLRDMNIKISLDDFGTGYSTFNYLKNIGIDNLKLDKCFIDDLAFDYKNQAIVNAIIQMAHSLNLKVVAEGVETRQQLHHLKSFSCDSAQGYIFSKPLPAVEFEKLISNGHSFQDLCRSEHLCPIKRTWPDRWAW